jgi:nicotinamide mononucleotide (NMN) deamidase PncC
MLASLLAEAPGASELLHGGFVTYTKANKTKTLGVSEELLAPRGAVCSEVAIVMAEGALTQGSSLSGVTDPVGQFVMQVGSIAVDGIATCMARVDRNVLRIPSPSWPAFQGRRAAGSWLPRFPAQRRPSTPPS